MLQHGEEAKVKPTVMLGPGVGAEEAREGREEASEHDEEEVKEDEDEEEDDDDAEVPR